MILSTFLTLLIVRSVYHTFMFLLYPSGGLGNQLFMVAATYAFAKTLGQRYYVDMHNHSLIQGHMFNTYTDSIFWQIPLAPLDRIFVIKDLIANRGYDSVYLADDRYNYSKFEIDPYNKKMIYIVMDSHFLAYQYFDYYYQDLIQLFTLPTDKAAHLEQLVAQYVTSSKNLPTVALHVRRGDYLTLTNSYVQLGTAYYKHSLEKFANLPAFKLVVFSDDIIWCQQELPQVANCQEVSYIPQEIEDYYALFMMSRCDHLIMANSTFSWWGAYLNTNLQKRIIFPETWFLDPSMNNKNLIMPNFELVATV